MCIVELSALEALCDYALYKSTFTLHYIYIPLPLEVGPLKLGVWGSAVSSPSGVWGGAPAEIDFGAF